VTGVQTCALPIFHGFATVRLEQAENYYQEAITLPMYATLTDDEVDRVAAEVAAQLVAAGAA